MKREDFFELRYLSQQDSRERTMLASMCEGKRRYESKREAERTIRKGKPISAFHCHVCRAWHIGAVRTAREKRLVLHRRREGAMCE